MLCPSCRAEVSVSSLDCSRCGAALSVGKGRTLVETPAVGSKVRTLVEASARFPAGGFVKGATLLEGDPPGKGSAVIESGLASSGKAKTVFDPGIPASAAAPASQPKIVGWLVSYSLDPAGTDYRIRGGRNGLGADAECDVRIAGAPSVSSRHAVIMARDGKVQIRDNDSTNGTYVNGTDIFGSGAVEIKNHDVIRLGDVELILVLV